MKINLRQMDIKRFFKKINYHFLKFPIKVISIFNVRFSVLCYNKLLKFSGVVLKGSPRFISTDVRLDSFELIQLGDRVVISEKVILLTHDYSFTTALIAINEIPKSDISINAKIVIGNNVFIGMGSILLPGVVIEDNVIIGAGSVVRGRVPSGSVYMGNPGAVIMPISALAQKNKRKSSDSGFKILFD